MKWLSGSRKDIAVLLVEDEIISRDVLADTIAVRFPELNIHLADNGSRGLEIFIRYRPKIVIADLNMPVMDGITMTSAIKELEPETIVIAVTSHNESHYLLNAIEIGINHYLTKPVDVTKLHSCIDKSLETLALKEQVRKQHALLQNILNSTTDLIYLKDCRGRYLLANSATAAMLNRSREEIVGHTDYDIFPAGVADGITADDRAILESGQHRILEETIPTADGVRQLSTMKNVCCDANGNVLGIVGITRDVTTQRILEEIIRDREELLRTIGNNLDNGAIYRTTTMTGEMPRFDFISAGIENISGVSAEEIMRDSSALYATFLPEDLLKLWEIQSAAASRMAIAEMEICQVNRATGKIHCSIVRSTPSRRADGAIVWDGLQFDISDRKRLENELRGYQDELEGLVRERTTDLCKSVNALELEIVERIRAENKLLQFSNTVEQSPVSIIITDVNGTIEYVNQKFTDITGYEREEVIGKNPQILKSGRTPDSEYRQLWRAIRSGNVWHGKFNNRSKVGDLFWEEATISPLRDKDGAITRFVAIKEDISDRMKLEEQLRHAQKMEGIGRLAGGIAHDFNNILTAIIGFGSVTQMRLGENDPNRKNIDEILAAADRAANLTHSLLAFSRKQIMNPKPLELCGTISKLEKFLKRIIGEDIQLETCETAPGPVVFADEGQLEQVLMNLATNARDAMPDGGTLTIETSCMTMDETFVKNCGFGIPGRYAVIAVSDSGSGMDQETLQKIFEPFFTTKEIGKGTGLGLSISFGIVKQHNGFIKVDSEPGAGAIFRIYLPLHTGEMNEHAAAGKLPPRGGTETILLAEDDPALRTLTVMVLSELGYTVVATANGEEAVQKFREEGKRIQLLLFDIIMPVKSGKQAYDEIRALCPDIRALFTSGYSGDFIDENRLLEEALSLVQKPVNPYDLARKVREALDR